jgi:ParB/RepB/Spo0J family partition protein
VILGDLAVPDTENNFDDPSVKQVCLIMLRPDQVVSRSQFQGHSPFDPENDPEDRDFARSIQEHGVIQPLIVYRIEKNGDRESGYGLISGHRRLDAALFCGLSTVPALLIPAEMSIRNRDLLTAIENLHRKDLQPVEKGTLIKSFMDAYGYNQKEVAEFIGISETQVSHLLSLLKASPEIREAVNARKLGVRNSQQLVKMAEPERRRALELVDRGISLVNAIEQIKAYPQSEDKVRNLADPESSNHGKGQPEHNLPQIESSINKPHAHELDPEANDSIARLLRSKTDEFWASFQERNLNGLVSEKQDFLLAVIWLASDQDIERSLSCYVLMTKAARIELDKALKAIDRLSVLYTHSNYAGALDSLSFYLNTAVQAFFGK